MEQFVDKDTLRKFRLDYIKTATANLSRDQSPFDPHLVKQHVTVLKQFKALLDAVERSNSRLEEFLAVAEARYVMYLELLSSQSHYSKQILPPWDVAIISYAHHLSPIGFLRDMKYLKTVVGLQVGEDGAFPLAGLAALIESYLWSDSVSLEAWNLLFPYSDYQIWPTLLSDRVDTDHKLPQVRINCPANACRLSIIVNSEQWVRIRNQSLSFDCPHCFTQLDKSRFSVAILKDDCKFFLANDEATNVFLRGADIRKIGVWYYHRPDQLDSLRQWATLVVNSSAELDSVEQAIDLFHTDKGTRAQQSEMKTVRGLIKLAYEQTVWPGVCCDLVEAATKLEPLIDVLPDSQLAEDLSGVHDAMDRYLKFMRLVCKMRLGERACYPLVATYDIALYGLTHALSPLAFISWCQDNVGQCFKYDVWLAEQWQPGAVRLTKALWSEAFDEPFDGSAELEAEVISRTEEEEVPRARDLNEVADLLTELSTTEGDFTAPRSEDVEQYGVNVPRLYVPLQIESGFRLLKFLHKDSDGRLHFDLQHFDLSSPPEYRALSYVWGTPWLNDEGELDGTSTSLEAAIMCNGLTVAITPNGLAFLEQLTLYLTPCYLWMDAICINQEDTKERAQQVGLMHDIYSKASNVIAWLGPTHSFLDVSPGPSHDLLRDFHWASTTFLIGLDRGFGSLHKALAFGTGGATLGNPIFWQRTGLPPSLLRLQRASYFSAMCVWFQRSWIVQEAVLAKEGNLHVLCGSTWLNWAGMVNLGVCFSTPWHDAAQHVASTIPEYVSRAPSMCIRALEFFLHGQDLRLQDGSRVDFSHVIQKFLNLLRMYRTTASSDPRDKIYALLSVLKRTFPEHAPALAEVIPIDYTSQTTSAYLYLRFAKLAIERLETLTLLTYVQADLISFDRDIKGLPYWVPDFSRGRETFPISDLAPKQRSFDIWGGQRLEWPRAEIHDKELRLLGIKIGTVGQSGRYAPTGRYDWLEICLPDIRRCQDQSRAETLMWTTLMRDRDSPIQGWDMDAHKSSFYHFLLNGIGCQIAMINPLNEGAWQTTLKKIEDVLVNFGEEIANHEVPDIQAILEYSKLPATYLNTQLSMETRQAAQNKYMQVQAIAQGYGHHSEHASKDRFLFRTAASATQPACLGLATWEAEEHDEIWMLYGGNVPFILRQQPKEPNKFKLVGDCYLHGYMRGERIEEEPLLLDEVQGVTLV